jgi:hypothetical protein
MLEGGEMEDVIRTLYPDDWSYKNNYIVSCTNGDFPYEKKHDAVTAFCMLLKNHGIIIDPNEIETAIESCGNYVIRHEVHPMGIYKL